MTLKKSLFILISLLLLGLCITSAGCLSIFHNENDYITTSNGEHYYFEDDNGRSFYETLYEGDVAPYVAGKGIRQWITFVQSLDVIDDVDSEGREIELFYNVDETMARGGGDCEDLAILMARGLKELGVDSAIIVEKYHVMAGISFSQVNSKYSYLLPLPYRGSSGFIDPTRSSSGLCRGVIAGEYFVIEPTANWDVGEYDTRMVIYEKIYVV